MKRSVSNGLVELEKVQESRFLLDGYLTRGSALRKSYGGKEYEIEQYQGEHANEYCVYEVKNGVRDGTAELFNDGIMTMRWTMKKGLHDGRFLLYDRGMVVREGRWSDVGRNEERVINNSKAELTMSIRVNEEIVYEGDFNESLERDGLGYEYENGVLKGYGEWRKDEFVALKQRFVSGEEMIEYGSGSTRDLLSHKPIYVGGYIFDEASGRMKRNGPGRVLNEWTGVCEYESEWEKGNEVENKRVRLHNGWYHEMMPIEFTRQAVTGYEPFKVDDKVEFEEPSQVVESSFSYSNSRMTELRLDTFTRLKRIEMGAEYCMYLDVLEIDGLNELESFKLSSPSPSFGRRRRPLSLGEEKGMRIRNCCKLKSIYIDTCPYDHSFELKNLPSLQSIDIGETCFLYAPSFSLASLFTD